MSTDNIQTQSSAQSRVPFPIKWRHPEDEQMMWLHDRLHYPDSIPPMEFSLVEGGTDAGITKAARSYDIPITCHDRHVNGYLYISVVNDELSAEEEATLAESSEEKLRDAMAHLQNLWDTEWLPEIKVHLDWWNVQMAGWQIGTPVDWVGLHTLLDETTERLGRLWEIHFYIFFPGMLSISQFVDLYENTFEEAEPFSAYKAITGFESKTVESASALWTLSRQILTSDTLREIFSQNSAREVLDILSQQRDQDIIKEYVQAFDAYLEEHGYRADKLSIYYPFWIEDPTPVIASLQDYILQPDRDLNTEIERKIEEREAAVADLRKQLQNYPVPIREEAEFLLKAAQEGSYLKEVHGYWIDYRGGYCGRRVLLEIGRNLVTAGVVETEEDVFYFYLDELRSLLATLANGSSLPDNLQTQVAERRQLEAQFIDITPPMMLGTESQEPPPDDDVSRMLFKIEGEPPPPSEDPNELRGHAGSPGIVEGTIKVVYMLKDAEKLEPGDILVAEATAPPWTPFFASVAGVITDTGGPLSHCAVVAREYGIPAVVGAGTATTALQDGQRVRIDGTRGIIHLIHNN